MVLYRGGVFSKLGVDCLCTRSAGVQSTFSYVLEHTKALHINSHEKCSVNMEFVFAGMLETVFS